MPEIQVTKKVQLIDQLAVHVFPKQVIEMGIWWNTLYVLLFLICYRTQQFKFFIYVTPVVWLLHVCFGGWFALTILVVCALLYYAVAFYAVAWAGGRAFR